ncbi:hypothetical protein KL3_00041 [Klebsiella phage KL3]|nr:hypothetical protein KL3_00041 [Klebsiella phage KL3]
MIEDDEMKKFFTKAANYAIAIGFGLLVTGFGLWVIALAGNFKGF